MAPNEVFKNRIVAALFIANMTRFLIDTIRIDWLFQKKLLKGKEHIRAEATHQKHWSFSECGQYAAAIEPEETGFKYWMRHLFCTRERLTLTIFDIGEGKAYDYIDKLWFLRVDYFHWYKGNIVAIQIVHDRLIRLNQLELDHEKRQARNVQIRDYVIPKLRTNSKPIEICPTVRYSLVYEKEHVTIRNIEYIPFFNHQCDQIVMIPRDINSDENVEIFVRRPSRSKAYTVGGLPVHGAFSFYPIVYGNSVYFLEVLKYAENSGNLEFGVTYRVFDSYLEVDLSKLENVAGKLIDLETVLLNQDLAASQEIKLKYDAPDYLRNFHLRKGASLYPARDGQLCVYVQDSTSTEPALYHVDLKAKHILTWKPSTNERPLHIEQVIYHPYGYFVEIGYQLENDGTYRLRCRPILHPKKINPLGYNERTTNILERKDMLIPLEILQILRNVL